MCLASDDGGIDRKFEVAAGSAYAEGMAFGMRGI